LFFTLELYEVNKEFSMPSDPEILQDFAYSIRSQEPNTVRVYVSILRGFSDWLSQQPGGAPFRPQAITEISIRSYMEHLAVVGRAPRTRSQVLTVLRRFCRWAMSEEYLTHNPANQVKRPTIVATAPRELTTGQRYVLRNRVKAERSWRLSAIFALGYWAGLRISEVAHLQVGHCSVNQRAGSLVILDSKGGKTRTIDLHNEARRALYKYLYQDNYQHKQARDPESAYVFTSQRSAWQRQQGRPDHLSTRGLEYIWTAMKERSRSDEYVIIEDITFHDLRHDFAHRARSAGWGLEEIAVYLGHQTRDGLPAIATTARYTLPSRRQLKKRLSVLPG
jgi:site-specific recombinase XerD